MSAWSVFLIAFAAVVVQARVSRKGDPRWYMGCVIPLLYGGAVAWMFLGEDLLRSLQIIIFGTAIPISMLFSLGRKEERKDDPAAQDAVEAER